MPLYSVEFFREQNFLVEIEAESVLDAQVKASQMTSSDVLGCHDYDGDLEMGDIYEMDENGDLSRCGAMPIRIGADEIATSLEAGQ